MLNDDFRYLFNILMEIRSDYFLFWGVHTTVCLAMIGWILAQKNDFTKATRLFASVGYAFFLVLMINSFLNLFGAWSHAIIDIKTISEDVIKLIPKDGFIDHMLNLNFLRAIIFTCITCFVCYIIILYLIFRKPFLFKNGK